MIPNRLELTNFLSYRDTAVLEFDGIHLACIAGLNGSGKSSILDGITWALFGKSRSSSDDDLVNRLAALNGEGAEVQFVFSLEKSIYRVIRRKRPRKRLMLELQIETGPDRWKTLSESGVRETQEVINGLLRMNYDTFINASFLLQGKADEFTTKTPNRRKEILADLLGVSQWDLYKAAVTDRRKEIEGRLSLLDGFLEDIELELEEEPARKEAVVQAQAEQAAIEERVKDKEALLAQLRLTEAAVQQQELLVKNLAANLGRAEKTLADLRRRCQQRQEERVAFQAMLDVADAIIADYAAWQGADATLSAWQAKADVYHKLQQEKRPHELAVTQARSRLEQRQQELEAQAERVRAAQKESHAVRQSRDEGEEQLQQLAAKLSELGEKEKIWHEFRDDLQRLESERQLLAQEREQLLVQQRRVQTMIDEEPAVSANAQEAQKLLADLEANLAAIAEQNTLYHTGKADLDNLRAEQPGLSEKMTELRERMDRLEAETGGECPLCGQKLSESHRQSVLRKLKAEGTELGDRYRANKERIEALAIEVPHLEREIRQKPRLEKDRVTQQQRLARAEARLEEIEQTAEEWKTAGHASRLEELQSRLADDSSLVAQKQKVAELAATVQKKATLEETSKEVQRQLSVAEARLGEIERLTGEWQNVGRTELADVEKRLDEGDYAREAHAELAALDADLSSLAYDPDAHAAARQAREELAQAQARHQELKQAEAAVKPLEDTIAELEQQIAEQIETAADLQQQHKSAAAELESIAAGSGDLGFVEQEVTRLREEQIAANRRLGAAQQRLNVLDDLRARREQLKGERAEVTQSITRLKRLEEACGRDGVQALLIEQALPDIEDRANELLDRLTGGDMRVSFETQRQLKSRDALKETLDIRIVDHAGERPYANFSGGEQFRVNFAIRLALSQVLAKRAGARLQTLVIDEGFGSQDPNGRQRLVEAINTIQDNFARILVITHVDELRDAFPTRIDVEKTVTGSTINLS